MNVEQVSTQIANLAIAHCGVSKPIGNIQTTKTLEAQMCRTFYDVARQATFRDSRWLFSVRQVAPTLVASQPTPEWLYAYLYPGDCIRILRFVSWRLSNDTRQSRVPYTIAQPVSVALSTLQDPPDAYGQVTGQWIYTNWPGVNGNLFPTILEYVFDNQDVSQWTPDFIMAFSYKLAEMIVTTVTSGDPYNKKQSIQQSYITARNNAQDDNFNEEQRPEEPQSEFIRARDGDYYGGFPGQPWVAEPSGFVIL